MLVDERTYRVRPGCMKAYLARHLAVALPVMREHLGEPLAYYTSVEGEAHQFVHLWRYEDAADRESRRARLYADPRWLAYREETGQTGWVVEQFNRLLNDVPVPASATAPPATPAPSLTTAPVRRPPTGPA